MKSGTINLEETIYAPVEGFAVSPKGIVTVELFSSDISETTNAELEGSLSNNRWDTLQNNGEDIVIAVAQSAAIVRSYEVDPKLSIRLKFGTATGSVSYLISE